MSAVNASINSTTLDAERRSHEPSMEEILASIRRIIADDDALPVVRRARERESERERDRRPPAAEVPRAAEPPRAAEARRAPTAPIAPPPPPAAVRPVAPSPVAEPAPPTPATEFWLRGAERHIAPQDAPLEAEIVDEEDRWEVDTVEDAHHDDADAESEEARAVANDDDAVVEDADASFDEQEEDPAAIVSTDAAASVASHFQALAASIVLSESDLVERYARDLLRPLLKQWLDDNLPHIVERLVRVEIERVARGRR
jgi:hypothetical protein